MTGVVTISRAYGAGGRRVAPAVAEGLGFRLVDREVVEEAGRRLGMRPEVAGGRDERTPALIEEVGMALAAGTPGFDLGATADLDDRALAEATRAVIESLADAGGYVILGRGGQAVLGRRANACHLSLVGRLEDRVARVMRWRGIGEREASSLCSRTDGERTAYVRRYFGVDIRDPLLYDCVLNTSRLGIQGAIDAALAVARARFAAG